MRYKQIRLPCGLVSYIRDTSGVYLVIECMQKKLRIAIICDAIDDETLGGSFISGKRFGAWLAKAGHDIIRITSKFEHEDKRKNFAYAKIYEFPHTPRIWVYGVPFAYTSAKRLYKIFQEENIDIIYSIQPGILAWQSVRAAKKLHIPIISHSHTLPDLYTPRAPRLIKCWVKKFVANMYRKYDGLISPTEFLQEKFSDCHFTMKQVVIGNGVDTQIFCPGKKSPHDIFTLLCVGRLWPEKNLPMVLDALHMLQSEKKLDKHIRCVFVGWGIMEEKLRNLVTSYGLWDVVEFTWILPTSSPRLVQAYQEASVFVLASLCETEGMVVLEAMGCGCPLLIINSPMSAATSFVHNNGYTFNPKDPQDLADKIYKLYTNPDLCELMGKVSAEQAQNFSFTLSIQKLESFFQSFVH